MLSVFVGSCSLYDMEARRVVRKMERADLTHATVTLGDAEVAYWRSDGEGTPLLLLHGFGGDAAFTWHEQLDLAEGRPVIAPDLLWFGDSASQGTPGLETQAEAMLALLDHEGLDAVDVVGISYGGLVTFNLAVRHPERFRHVVLVDSPGPVFTAEDREAALARFEVASLSDLVVPDEPRDVRRLVELAYYKPPSTPGFVLADVYRNGFLDHVDEKHALVAELERRIGQIGEWTLPQPTLLLWGEHDPLFPVAVGERLAAAIGDHARLEVIADASHAPNLEQPERFNDLVSAFLSEAVPAPVPEPLPEDESGWTFDAQPLDAALREAITGVSWHSGCPVGLDALRVVTLAHVGYDGAVHEGQMIVIESAVSAVEAGFRAAFDAAFPIERMEPVHRFGGSDDASMAANNTSAFNCREVAGGTGWSRHSYGDAIDVNPVQNPYVKGKHVLPPAGSAFLERDPSVTGLITGDSAIVSAFVAQGWGWGGTWSSMKDYQHFSATGR